MTTEVLAAVFAFVGAAVGSVLPFLASRASTRQEGAQGRREEWGRRFSTALQALTTGDARQRAAGRALLDELMSSDLATEDDRRAALAVLKATANYDERRDQDLRAAIPSDEVDDTGVVEDTGGDDPGEER